MAAARLVLAALLLAVAASSAFAAAPAGRSLMQSGVSCPAQIPACTARRCTTRILDSRETYVCLRCQRGYVPVLGSDGRSAVQCVCPPGTYQFLNGTSRSCQVCPAGSFCPGGSRTARLPTDNIGGGMNSCNANGTDGLTTKSQRSTRAADCIAKPGYVLPATLGQPALACTGSTYAPAFNRLRACLPCQSGLAAPEGYNGTRENRLDVCQVPPGKFWELNVVRDCPKGLYREAFVRTDDRNSISCKSCPEGWTTAEIGTPALRLCNVLLPGYQVINNGSNNSTNNGTIDTNATEFIPLPTEFCSFGTYSDGTTLGCKPCPYGATTLRNASISADECVVPPGYFVRDSATGGEMVQCLTTPANAETEGYYRPGWKAYKEVLSTNANKDGTDICSKCGENIMSRAVDVDEHPNAAPGSKAPATSASCFIKAGWGITFDPADFALFKAIKPCPANTYGVANDTFGLINAPCKACTKNLYSLAGSTKFNDCLNPGGFGYTSEGANQCPDGFWAAKDSMAPCKQCPPGKTTLYQPANGTLQDSIEDCFAIAGHGAYEGNTTDPWNPTNPSNGSLPARSCPIGLFSAGGIGAKCEECPEMGSTSREGSETCDTCIEGFGKDNATSPCSVCMFGWYNPGITSATCSQCPETTFNDFVGDGYTSYGTTFKIGEARSEACVPRYAQLPKPVGDRMGLPDAMFTVNVSVTSAANDNAAVKMCVEACPAESCCIAQMVKSDSGISCKHARLEPTMAMFLDGTARMFYKVPPSQIAAASKDKDSNAAKAKTMGSGLYAVCDITQWLDDTKNGYVGTSPNPLLVEAGRNAIEWNTPECNSIDTCKASCLANAVCWGFVLAPTPDGMPGFALRGGESWLGGRTFFASPDAKLAMSVAEVVQSWSWFSS